MKKLENYSVQEMSAKEIKNTEGGGWIADAVSALVSHYKCGCSPSPHDVPEFAYGLI
tara:strand:- start:1204 stop:1374 length:171 start_codon:yes stop_codon:yes gene_type:complete